MIKNSASPSSSQTFIVPLKPKNSTVPQGPAKAMTKSGKSDTIIPNNSETRERPPSFIGYSRYPNLGNDSKTNNRLSLHEAAMQSVESLMSTSTDPMPRRPESAASNTSHKSRHRIYPDYPDFTRPLSGGSANSFASESPNVGPSILPVYQNPHAPHRSSRLTIATHADSVNSSENRSPSSDGRVSVASHRAQYASTIDSQDEAGRRLENGRDYVLNRGQVENQEMAIQKRNKTAGKIALGGLAAATFLTTGLVTAKVKGAPI